MGKQEEYQYFHTLIVISPPKSGHAKKLLIVDCFPHYSLYKKNCFTGTSYPGRIFALLESLKYTGLISLTRNWVERNWL